MRGAGPFIGRELRSFAMVHAIPIIIACLVIVPSNARASLLVVDEFGRESVVGTPAQASAGACGAPGAGSCFEIHNWPGCADADCCTIVCELDSFCCDESWDETCVTIATISCEPPPTCPSDGSCFLEHATPGCEDAGCCANVCELDIGCCLDSWTQECVLLALEVCAQAPACPADGACFDAHASPGCDDGLCCLAVCAQAPSCCTTAWTTECVATALAVCDGGGTCPGEGNCLDPQTTPGCADVDCCIEVCAQDPFCCENTWDETCVKQALVLCAGIGACPGQGSCFLPHETVGCNDLGCCLTVCAVDSYCCTVAWDLACTKVADAACEVLGACPSVGDCFSVHDTPGCDDAACCAEVCALDPYCCETEWDEFCVAYAISTCAGSPNCPGTGDCHAAHPTPGCDDGICCTAVCLSQTSCCEQAWDETCVNLAEVFCAADLCPNVGTIASTTPASGTVDARQPHAVNAALPRFGIGSDAEPILIQLNVDADPSCFGLCESAPDPLLGPNSIASITELGGGAYRVVLTRAITAGGATVIRYLGDSSTASFIAHPANTNGDNTASPIDILFMIDALNGVQQPPHGLYSTDIDHSGVAGPADILRVIDLLNGAGEFAAWNGTPRPNPATACP